MDIMVVINQMVMLFTIMMMGYLAVKIGIIDQSLQKSLSHLIVNVTLPLLMISSVAGADRSKAGATVSITFIVAAISYISTPIIGRLIALLLRVPKEQVSIYVFFTVFSNIGFMGFPVIDAIFGPQALIMAIIFNLLFNVLGFTYGVALYSGGDTKLEFQTFLTPAVIASIASIVMFLVGIGVPEPFQSAIKSLGSATTPLAMLVIGISLSTIPLKQVFSELRLYPYTLIKQVALPAIAYLILKLVIDDPLLIGVTVIVLAMPIATLSVILANEHDREVILSTQAVFLTTLASVFTIPLIAALLAI